MKTPSISTLTFILLLIFSCSRSASADGHDDFLECLSEEFEHYPSLSSVVYTPNNSSYTYVLKYTIQNLRFALDSTPKPLVIVTPEHESQIPPVIYCAKESGVEIRTRSCGHDAEGLSYVAKVPFVIIDFIKLDEITIDVEKKTAWVGAGANIGSLCYKIAEKSPTLGFPVGISSSVGVGGQFSGGGFGPLMRKYGLAADNIIDAKIVDVNGKILDRKSMGEDLFWAIRGGGGASFGVIVAWKIKLVDVPERVTVFTVSKTLEQNATQLIHRWQYVAPKFDKDLYLMILASRVNSSQDGRTTTVLASFMSLFLGGVDKLLPLMQENFPELGLVRENCTEMSWIDSIVYFAGFPIESRELILNKTEPELGYYKAKTDYVQRWIPEDGFEGMWRLFHEPEGEGAQLLFNPQGGRMDEISKSATPYPHRAGNLYSICYFAYWNDAQSSDKFISWVRRVYSHMTPYVSKSPRASYVNFRDLDIGMNNNEGKTSYAQARIWGKKYFKNNFDRLVRVKTIVDPKNFFKYEQSIPPMHSRWTKKGD